MLVPFLHCLVLPAHRRFYSVRLLPASATLATSAKLLNGEEVLMVHEHCATHAACVRKNIVCIMRGFLIVAQIMPS